VDSRNRPYTIAEIKDIVTPIARTHGVAKVYLFGSYARGEATGNSDIDLRIDSGKITTLFALGGFYSDLEEYLQKTIDIVTEDSMSERFYNRIKNEEIMLYG
jgi:predicted nucleotidyltransferase